MKIFHNEWEKWVIIACILFLIFIGLSGCNHQMVPYETKMEYGTTDTDSKNDKLSEKRFITQTWRWKHD
jgi:hypothetical protein